MNPLEIREIATAFQKSRIVLTAYELDIFTFIDEQSHDAENISKALNLDKGALERLLDALVSLKLLIKDGKNYSNTEDSIRFLSKNSPDYLAGLMHTNHLWVTWSHLSEVIKTGNRDR